MKRNRTITLAAAALTLSVLGGTGMAVANASSHNPSTGQVQTTDRGDEAKGAGESEGAEDQAAQDAACKAAGVDLSASNINFDDKTGVCTLDSSNDGDTND